MTSRSSLMFVIVTITLANSDASHARQILLAGAMGVPMTGSVCHSLTFVPHRASNSIGTSISKKSLFSRMKLFKLKKKLGIAFDPKPLVRANTVNEMREQICRGTKFWNMHIAGNTSVDDPPLFSLNSSTDYFSHPVIQLIKERLLTNSKPGARKDKLKLGLAIEGGGMRGAVSAGMCAALHAMGLYNVFDVVYGSSAGSLIGVYFIAQQVVSGCKLYYNWLTRKGTDFIDKFRLFRTVGLGPLAGDMGDWRADKLGSPVLKLNYLFDDVLRHKSPIDYEEFERREKQMPLRIIASGLQSHHSIPLSRDQNHYSDLNTLSECLRASMLLPGIAGPPVRLYTDYNGTTLPKMVGMTFPNHTMPRTKTAPSYGSEMLADALLFEAIPYRSAIKDGCTHVLVLRSRQDHEKVAVADGLTEWLTSRRFFKKKLGLDILYRYVRDQEHRRLYAEDVLRLNRYTWGLPAEKSMTWPAAHQLPWFRWMSSEVVNPNDAAKVFCIAPQPHFEYPQIDRLERSRRKIFTATQRGFARVYDVLGGPLLCDDYFKERFESKGAVVKAKSAVSVGLNGRGWDVASSYFSEEDFEADKLPDSRD